MIKLKIVNPVGDITHELEIENKTDIESFKSSHRIILESSDGSEYNYSSREWMELPETPTSFIKFEKKTKCHCGQPIDFSNDDCVNFSLCTGCKLES